jgi:hypothetical protein
MKGEVLDYNHPTQPILTSESKGMRLVWMIYRTLPPQVSLVSGPFPEDEAEYAARVAAEYQEREPGVQYAAVQVYLEGEDDE